MKNKQTIGSKAAAKARKICNNLPQQEKDALFLKTLRLVDKDLAATILNHLHEEGLDYTKKKYNKEQMLSALEELQEYIGKLHMLHSDLRGKILIYIF